MKQDCDNQTIDMYGDEVRDSLTTHHKTSFRFYVKAHDGLTTEWTGLTRKQARDMYSYTDKHQPSNVIAYGWEEVQ